MAIKTLCARIFFFTVDHKKKKKKSQNVWEKKSEHEKTCQTRFLATRHHFCKKQYTFFCFLESFGNGVSGVQRKKVNKSIAPMYLYTHERFD